MKNWLNRYALPMATAIYAAFFVIFMCTFDSYSLQFITPETPFLNIAGVAFHRVEFVILLFCLTFAVGAVVGILLKNKVRKVLPFCAVMLGIITIFIGMLNVDLVQKLFPTMRISHVIMTVSRLVGILLGIAGIFVGISSIVLIKHIKYTLTGIVVGGGFSIFAESAKAFNIVYLLVGIAIVAIAVVLQYFMTEEVAPQSVQNPFSKNLLQYSNVFFSAGAMIFFAIVGYVYFNITLNASSLVFSIVLISSFALYLVSAKISFNTLSKCIVGAVCLALWIATIVVPDIVLTSFAVVSSFILLGSCTSACDNKSNMLLSATLGAIVFSVIACVLNHCLADITKHSGNRVVYAVSEYAWIIFVAIVAIVMTLSLVTSHKEKRKVDEV